MDKFMLVNLSLLKFNNSKVFQTNKAELYGTKLGSYVLVNNLKAHKGEGLWAGGGEK
jgi:hypothetical protein